MGLIPRKRWRVVRHSKLSGAFVPASEQEARRTFWRHRSAVKELNRLTRIASATGLPYAYRVQRVHGK